MDARPRHLRHSEPPSFWTNSLDLQSQLGFSRIDYTADLRPSLAKRVVRLLLRVAAHALSSERG